MKDDKNRSRFVTLKSALKKATVSAALIGGLLIPTAQAADIGEARQTLEQRVQIVSDALRKKLSEGQSADSAQASDALDADETTAQWVNWYNWGNWNNWKNWANWNNWYNWVNWVNY